jgi:signal peptidase II
MLKRKKQFAVVFFLIFGLIFLDQITKIIFTNKSFFSEYIISIVFTKNTGSAFSMFSTFQTFNIIIIIISIIFITIFLIHKDKVLSLKHGKWILILLLSGVTGNLLDRISFGYVRDFIKVDFFSVFNLADVYLTIAALLIIISTLSDGKSLKNKNANV